MAEQADRTDQFVLLQHWDSNTRPYATKFERCIVFKVTLLALLCCIEDVNHRLGSDHAAKDIVGVGTNRRTSACLGISARRIMRRHEAKGVAIPAIDISQTWHRRCGPHSPIYDASPCSLAEEECSSLDVSASTAAAVESFHNADITQAVVPNAEVVPLDIIGSEDQFFHRRSIAVARLFHGVSPKNCTLPSCRVRAHWRDVKPIQRSVTLSGPRNSRLW